MATTISGGNVYFMTLDYVMLGVMLALSTAIGIYFSITGNRQGTKEEYLLGGRRMSPLPVCLSLFATFQSAISLLGFPNEIYSYGTMYTYIMVSTALSSLLAVVSVVPLLYPLQLTSVFQYLALRYESRVIEKFGATIGILTGVSYMTMALVSPALAVETTAGIPLWLSIVVIGSVGAFYTTLEGITSVIWTDVIQSFFMFIGMLTVLVKGCIDAGGITNVWNVNKETGRIILDDISIDPRVRHTVWNLSFGCIVFKYSAHFSQSSVQRIISTRSIKDGAKVHLFTVPVTVVYYTVLLMTGLVMSAYFHITRCDPLSAGFIKNSNQVMPYFVLITLRFLPGFSGLYISAIFSGALSTLSSGINSLAANTVDTFLVGFLRGKSEFMITSVVKMFVCFYGCVAIFLAYIAKDFQGPVRQINYTILGPSVGAQIGLFLLGAIFPQANYVGAIVGCCAGLVISAWQATTAFKFGHPTKTLPKAPVDRCFAQNITHYANGTEHWMSPEVLNLTTISPYDFTQETEVSSLEHRDFSIYDLSYSWNPLIGVLVTVTVGLFASFIASSMISEKLRPEAKFIFPFCRRFWYSSYDIRNNETDMHNSAEEHGMVMTSQK